MTDQNMRWRPVCDYGYQVPVEVPIPGHLSHTGLDRWDHKMIDWCIVPIVEALNAGGVFTVASCCGHGKGGGSIILWDDRELVLRPTDEFTRLQERVEELEADLQEMTDSRDQFMKEADELHLSKLREAGALYRPGGSDG